MPQQADFQRDGIVEGCGFERLRAPVLFSYKTSDPMGASAAASKLITSEFLRGLPTLLAQKPKSIVLWANHDFRPRDKAKIRAAIPRRIAVRVEGRSDLEQRLLQHPHLLTKYFGWSEFLECLRSDDHESIRRAVAGGPLAEAVPFEGVHHPKAAEVGNVLGKHLRIVGAPGSGKSFFLYRLLSALKDTDIVILKSLDRALTWDHVGQLLQAARRPIVFVVDNLHDYFCEGYATDVLGPLVDNPATGKAPIAILVSHWTAKRHDVERAIPVTQWTKWGFQEISLDDPPTEFICAVVKAACAHLGIEVQDGMRDAFVKEIRGWENTPACVVASLLPYRGKVIKSELGFYPVSLKVRDATWRNLFADLSNKGTPEEPIVLRALSVLRWCGQPQPRLETVREVASKVGGTPVEKVDHAIERLERAGWIHRESETVRSHDLQIFPPTVGLHETGKPSLFLERFAQLVSDDALSSLHAERQETLRHLGGMYWDLGQPQRSIHFNDMILAGDPRNIRALCNRATCLFKCSKTDDGIANLSKAMEIDPGEVGAARLLYSTYRRLGRVNEALEVLNRAERGLPEDSLGLAFLSQAYADLHEGRKAVKCALRLAHARPDDPEAFCVLVHALWMSRRRKRAQSVLDRALRKWPTVGVLLHVKADIEEQLGNRKGALDVAEKALKLCPNNPGIYALAAWLNMTTGDLQRASEIAETGVDLFRSWPDLLTVWGMLLEKRDELQEADRVLRRAFERSDHFSDLYRPNLLLALGRVAIRLGNESEAEQWFKLADEAGVERAFLLDTKADAFRVAGRIKEAIQALREAANTKPDSADGWRQLAGLCITDGDYQQAIESMRKAVAIEPGKSDYLFALAVALEQVNQIDETAVLLRRVVELTPKHADAWRKLGACLLQQGKAEEAVTVLCSAISKGASDDRAHLLYAEALRQTGKLQEAICQCKQIQSRSPAKPGPHAIEALCHLDLGDRRRAAKTARRAVQCGNDDVELWSKLLGIAVQAGLTEEAYASWRKGRERGWVTQKVPERVLHKFCMYLHQENRHEEAMEVLECVHSQYGPDMTIMLNMARCALNLRRLDEAVDRYSALISHFPLHLIGVRERAGLLLGLGRRDQVLRADSDIYKGTAPWLAALYMAEAWFVAGDVLQTTEQFLSAVQLLPDPATPEVEMRRLIDVMDSLEIGKQVREAIGVSVKKEHVSPGEAHFLALLCSDRDENLLWLRRAHELAPDRMHLMLDLATAEVFSGNAARSSSLARAVLAMQPQTTIALAQAGRALMLSGAMPDETLAIAEKAIQLGTPRTSLWAALHLKADSLNELGRFEDAFEAGQEAMNDSNDSYMPMTVMTVLRSLQALGRNTEAMALADGALARFPNDIELKMAKALLLNLAGRDKECVQLVRRMGAAGAVMVTPLLDMGDCLLRAKRYGHALKCYQSARKNMESSGGTIALQRYYIRAVCGEVSVLVAQDKKRKALQALDSVGESDVIKSDLWLLRVSLCADKLRDHAEVLRTAEARLAVSANDINAHWYRAGALCALQKYEDAMAALEQAVQLAGKRTADSLHLKARILAGLQRYAESIELLSEEVESRSELSKEIHVGPIRLILDLLPKCNPPPAIGLELATVLLGAFCVHPKNHRNGRFLVKRLQSLDWREVAGKAETGDQASQLALAVMSKAEGFFGSGAKKLKQTPKEASEQSGDSTPFIHGLLRSMLIAEWVRPNKKANRSARRQMNKVGRVTGRNRSSTAKTRRQHS